MENINENLVSIGDIYVGMCMCIKLSITEILIIVFVSFMFITMCKMEQAFVFTEKLFSIK